MERQHTIMIVRPYSKQFTTRRIDRYNVMLVFVTTMSKQSPSKAATLPLCSYLPFLLKSINHITHKQTLVFSSFEQHLRATGNAMTGTYNIRVWQKNLEWLRAKNKSWSLSLRHAATGSTKIFYMVLQRQLTLLLYKKILKTFASYDEYRYSTKWRSIFAFLNEYCNFVAMSGYCRDMLSVYCLLSSVTRVYCDKMTELMITQFLHYSIVRS